MPFEDGYAAFGRLNLQNFEYHSIPRAEGIAKYINRMSEFDHWRNTPTGWINPKGPSNGGPSGANPKDPSNGGPSGADNGCPSGADLEVAMLKVPTRPLVISVVLEHKTAALVAKKSGCSAKRKLAVLCKS